MKLADRVRELRYTKGWGPDDLAHRAKISRTALYHLESGRTARPQAGTLRKIARALEVLPEELLRECQTSEPEVRHPDASDQRTPADRLTAPLAHEVASSPLAFGESSEQILSVTLSRIARMLGVAPEILLREDLLLSGGARSELSAPSRTTVPEGSEDPQAGSRIHPEVARELIEKFLILLSSPLAKGIVQIIEESFRLLPILPSLSGHYNVEDWRSHSKDGGDDVGSASDPRPRHSKQQTWSRARR